ncbi:unnamed protein product [Brassica napus]|uniref:histone acetyltransferase n=1 Tax=Brassica napus TaxID=3708 RepID=A0A816TJF3_BRANA|nr:unnamed protein product [Brassica napus]
MTTSLRATACAICKQDLEPAQRWRCEVCPDYEVCGPCYSNGIINHPHTLITPPSPTGQLRAVLLHVTTCCTTQCQYPRCRTVKQASPYVMVLHAKRESAIIVRECGISSVYTPETAGSPNAQYPNAVSLELVLVEINNRQVQDAEQLRYDRETLTLTQQQPPLLLTHQHRQTEIWSYLAVVHSFDPFVLYMLAFFFSGKDISE